MNQKRGLYRYPKQGGSRPRHMGAGYPPPPYDDEPPPKRQRHASTEPTSNGGLLLPLLPLPTKERVREEVKDLYQFSKDVYNADDAWELDLRPLHNSIDGTLASRRLGASLALTASQQISKQAEVLSEILLQLADQNREVGGGNGENGGGNGDSAEVMMFNEGIEDAAKGLLELMRHVAAFKDAGKYRKVIARVMEFVVAGKDQARQDMQHRRAGSGGNYATPNFGHGYCVLALKSFQRALKFRPVFVLRACFETLLDNRGGLKQIVEYLITREEGNEENESHRSTNQSSDSEYSYNNNQVSNSCRVKREGVKLQEDKRNIGVIQEAVDNDPEGQMEMLRMLEYYRGIALSSGNRYLESLLDSIDLQLDVLRPLGYNRGLLEDPRIASPNLAYGHSLPLPPRGIRDPLMFDNRPPFSSRITRSQSDTFSVPPFHPAPYHQAPHPYPQQHNTPPYPPHFQPPSFRNFPPNITQLPIREISVLECPIQIEVRNLSFDQSPQQILQEYGEILQLQQHADNPNSMMNGNQIPLQSPQSSGGGVSKGGTPPDFLLSSKTVIVTYAEFSAAKFCYEELSDTKVGDSLVSCSFVKLPEQQIQQQLQQQQYSPQLQSPQPALPPKFVWIALHEVPPGYILERFHSEIIREGFRNVPMPVLVLGRQPGLLIDIGRHSLEMYNFFSQTQQLASQTQQQPPPLSQNLLPPLPRSPPQQYYPPRPPGFQGAMPMRGNSCRVRIRRLEGSWRDQILYEMEQMGRIKDVRRLMDSTTIVEFLYPEVAARVVDILNGRPVGRWPLQVELEPVLQSPQLPPPPSMSCQPPPLFVGGRPFPPTPQSPRRSYMPPTDPRPQPQQQHQLQHSPRNSSMPMDRKVGLTSADAMDMEITPHTSPQNAKEGLRKIVTPDSPEIGTDMEGVNTPSSPPPPPPQPQPSPSPPPPPPSETHCRFVYQDNADRNYQKHQQLLEFDALENDAKIKWKARIRKGKETYCQVTYKETSSTSIPSRSWPSVLEITHRTSLIPAIQFCKQQMQVSQKRKQNGNIDTRGDQIVTQAHGVILRPLNTRKDLSGMDRFIKYLVGREKVGVVRTDDERRIYLIPPYSELEGELWVNIEEGTLLAVVGEVTQ